MDKSSNKKMLMIGAVVIVLIIIIVGVFLMLSRNGGNENNNSSSDTQNESSGNLTAEHRACYDQCEEWGGEVAMCKENCDASFSEDSVWNDEEEDVVADNDSSFDSWEEMPLAVPNFSYGDFVSGEKGMNSWIVDFENVTDSNAMGNYVSDLEDYDWTVSYMSVSNMITGSKEGYTISISLDPDYNTLQIIVRESN